MTFIFDYAAPGPPLQTQVAYPTAAVTKGRWTDTSGNQIAVAGARARGIAYESFSASEVAAVAAGSYPTPSLAIVILGWARVTLGGHVDDNALVTCDNQGRTVALAANDEVLGFVPKGGEVGDERAVFVFRNEGARAPAAAIADLVAASGAADGTIVDVGGAFSQATLNNNVQDIVTKLNALLAALRLQKVIS